MKMVKVKKLLLFSIAVFLGSGAVAVRGQSALDGFDPNANGAVRVVVVQPDGKILIGGDFTTLSPNGGAAVTRNRIARLNPDGTLDTAFNPNANDTVYAIAVQADGKILVGGDFTGEQHRRTDAQPHRPARCHAPDWLIRSTRTRTVLSIAIAVQADGKILAGGNFTTASADRRATASPGSMPRPDWLIRSTRTRTVLSLSIAVQADGKILAGGFFSGATASADRRAIASPGSMPRPAWLIRSTRTRTVRSRAIAVQADGKILAGGAFTCEQHRRTDAQPHRPARCHHRSG